MPLRYINYKYITKPLALLSSGAPKLQSSTDQLKLRPVGSVSEIHHRTQQNVIKLTPTLFFGRY